ncbi:MFS transporter [Neisseriaceae bacterium JH1-16]|nr:MFS transporter [Neisseriaceae bacterium JH1-16]
MAEQLRLARRPALLGHVSLSVLSFTGMFTAYTYLADLLERLAGLHGPLVGWALMVFGAVGLIGNGLGGRLVDRSARRAMLLFSLVLALGLLALVPASGNYLTLAVVLGTWWIAQAALFIVNNARLMQAVPEAPAFGSALNIAGANAGIALGALLGGRVIDAIGHAYLGEAAALLIGLSMLLALRLMPARPSLMPTLAERG